MREIDHKLLSKDMLVWYKHSKTEGEPSGPFKVVEQFSNHEGPQVRLTNGLDGRVVSLADDEDFGEPIFYVNTDEH